MARRIIGIVLTLLGAAAIVVGVLSTTSWRTSDTVTATSPTADVPFVVIEPGVAGVVDDRVDVAITAADPAQTVTVITGRDVDVDGWLADAAHQRLVDVVDWDQMVTEDVEGVTEGVPSPVGNDMWLDTQEADGELAFTYDVPTTGRQTLLVVRDGDTGPAPTVSFTWAREVTTPYFVPLMSAGIPAVVLGLALIVWSFVARRNKKNEAALATAGAEGDPTPGEASVAAGSDGEDAETSVLPRTAAAGAAVGSGEPGEPSDPPTAETAVLTRRQLRALGESGAGGAAGTTAYEGLQERLAAVDVDRIAADIAPADDRAAPPDAPEAYPGWLRAQEEGREDGATEVAEPPARPTWSERWGLAVPAPESESEGEEPVTPPEASELEPLDAPGSESEPVEVEPAASEPVEVPEPEPLVEPESEPEPEPLVAPEPGLEPEPLVEPESEPTPSDDDAGHPDIADHPETDRNEEDR
ncbi:hypothetical protein [Serinibacter arcticus]|uniref:hypothetical protein n=1 Tax=Serinibacter arcticus TaxID=1655435 RepID=UPI0018EE493A|nr:hypothetical protein [Serinibacter arcticus]